MNSATNKSLKCCISRKRHYGIAGKCEGAHIERTDLEPPMKKRGYFFHLATHRDGKAAKSPLIVIEEHPVISDK